MRRRTMMVGGMVVLAASGTAAAMKMTQQEAQQIEQHTGMPPQDLEDDDLQEAMTELGIQGQPLSEQEQAQLAAESPPPAAAPQAAAPAAPQAPAGEASVAAELEKLADMHARNIISDDEFNAAKSKLLGL